MLNTKLRGCFYSKKDLGDEGAIFSDPIGNWIWIPTHEISKGLSMTNVIHVYL